MLAILVVSVIFFLSVLGGHLSTAEQRTAVEPKVAVHLSGLSGPTSQFLNGANEFSELVLSRMAQLMDQSRSVLPLRSAKARELESSGRRTGQNQFSSADQNGEMESDLRY